MNTIAALPLAVDLPEAARMASVSVSTIRRAIAAGELPAAKLGVAVRVRPVDLDGWLKRAAGSNDPAIIPIPEVHRDCNSA